METGRLTPEMVIAAYRETGLQPRRYVWSWRGYGADALGALAVHRYGPKANDDTAIMRVGQRLDQDLNLTADYRLGFTEGWDENLSGMDPALRRPRTPGSAEQEQGYVDGKAAWAAVQTSPEIAAMMTETNQNRTGEPADDR